MGASASSSVSPAPVRGGPQSTSPPLLYDDEPNPQLPGQTIHVRGQQNPESTIELDDSILMDQEVVAQTSPAVLKGDFDAAKSGSKRRLRIFMSSTFTDTKAERNYLMKFVYPVLRASCRRHGIEFSVVDLRWGIRDESTDNHMTWDICSQEIDRSFNESIDAVCFVLFLSHRYGYCPLQRVVNADEFDKILEHIEEAKLETLNKWYKKDLNVNPVAYVLQPLSTFWGDVTLKDRFKKWWPVEEELLSLIRNAVTKADLNQEEKDKWFISVTEQEIRKGIFDNLEKAGDRCLVLRRQISPFVSGAVKHTCQPSKVDPDLKVVRKFIDADNDGNSPENTWRLEALHQRIMDSNQIPQKTYNVTWSKGGISQEAHLDYIKLLASDFKTAILQSVQKALAKNPPFDAISEEAASHLNFALNKAKTFTGRETLLAKVNDLLKSAEALRHPIVVAGGSGCGKTALIAKIAFDCKAVLQDDPILIVRFCGTSANSTTPVTLLNSLCEQLSFLCGRKFESTTRYRELCDKFESILVSVSDTRKVVILIDSLDQLSDECFGRSDPRWIPTECPANVVFIVSTLPVIGGALSALRLREIPVSNYIDVPVLPKADITNLLNGWLSSDGKCLQKAQKDSLLKFAGKDVTALHLKLLYDTCGNVKSYDDMNNPGATVPEILNYIFDGLEAKHGDHFVRHVSALIQVSRAGVAEDEALDMLSCVDSVVNAALQYHNPPVRRIPHIIMALFRFDVRNYLIERGQYGRLVMAWYHRQFWNVIVQRYMPNLNIPKSVDQNGSAFFQILCNYYSNQFHKTYTGRQLLPQPSYFESAQHGKIEYNEAKLFDLPYAATRCKDFGIWTTMCTGRFVRSCLSVNLGSAFLEQLSAALEAVKDQTSTNDDSTRAKISILSAWRQFIVSNLHVIQKYPSLLAQQVSLTTTDKKTSLTNSLGQSDWPNAWHLADKQFLTLELLNQVVSNEACLFTLTSHTQSVRSLVPLKIKSAEYTHVLSTSEDCSVRLWSVGVGKEVLKTTMPYLIPCALATDPVDKTACAAFYASTSVVAIELWHILMDEDGNLSTNLYSRVLVAELDEEKSFLNHLIVVSEKHKLVFTSISAAEKEEDDYFPKNFGLLQSISTSPLKKPEIRTNFTEDDTTIIMEYSERRSALAVKLTIDEAFLIIGLGNIKTMNDLVCPSLEVRTMPKLEQIWKLYSCGLPSINDIQILSCEPFQEMTMLLATNDALVNVVLNWSGENQSWADKDVVYVTDNSNSHYDKSIIMDAKMACISNRQVVISNVPESSQKFNLKEIGTLAGHSTAVSCIANVSNSTGQQIIWSGSADGEIKVWDVGSCSKVASGSHKTAIMSCAISDDRKFIITGGDFDGRNLAELKTWNPENGKLIHTSQDGETDRIDSIRFMAGGDLMVFRVAGKTVNGSEGFAVRFCPTEYIRRPNFPINHPIYRERPLTNEGVTAGHDVLGVSPDGATVVFGDGRCNHWLTTVYEHFKHEGCSFKVHGQHDFNTDEHDELGKEGLGLGACYYHDMSKLLIWFAGSSKSTETDLQQLNAAYSNTKEELDNHSVLKLCIPLKHDLDMDQLEKNYDAVKQLASVKAPRKPNSNIVDGSEIRIGFTVAAFVGDQVIACIHDGSIELRNGSTLELVRDVKGHETFINCLKVTDDDKHFVTGSDDNFIKVWLPDSLMPIATYYAGSSVRGLTCYFNSHNSLVVAGGDTTGRLHLIKVTDVKKVKATTTNSKVTSKKINLYDDADSIPNDVFGKTVLDVLKRIDITKTNSEELKKWRAKWILHFKDHMQFNRQDLSVAWKYTTDIFKKHESYKDNQEVMMQFGKAAIDLLMQACVCSSVEDDEGRLLFVTEITKDNPSSLQLILAKAVHEWREHNIELGPSAPKLQRALYESLLQDYTVNEWDDVTKYQEALKDWLSDVTSKIMGGTGSNNRKLLLSILGRWMKNAVVNPNFDDSFILEFGEAMTAKSKNKPPSKDNEDDVEMDKLFLWLSPDSTYYADDYLSLIMEICSHDNFKTKEHKQTEFVNGITAILCCAICKIDPKMKPKVEKYLEDLDVVAPGVVRDVREEMRTQDLE